MTRKIFSLMIVLITGLGLGACSSQPATVVTPSPTAVPTSIGSAPTSLPIAPTGPTFAPTETPAETPAPTATITPTRTATATRRPATATATRRPATATAVAAPGVYVTAIKIDPNPGKSGQSPTFTVTFENRTGQPQIYRWFIKIYEKDQPQSFGETSKLESWLPINTITLPSVSDWKTTAVASECSFYIARVFWLDANNQVNEFSKPNGASTATGFNVCPFP